jgi:hypothetical protein
VSTATLTRKPQTGITYAEWEIILLDLDPKAPVKALVGTAPSKPKGAPVEKFYDPVTDEHITFDSDTAVVTDTLTGVSTMHHFLTGTTTMFLVDEDVQVCRVCGKGDLSTEGCANCPGECVYCCGC